MYLYIPGIRNFPETFSGTNEKHQVDREALRLCLEIAKSILLIKFRLRN